MKRKEGKVDRKRHLVDRKEGSEEKLSHFLANLLRLVGGKSGKKMIEWTDVPELDGLNIFHRLKKFERPLT